MENQKNNKSVILMPFFCAWYLEIYDNLEKKIFDFFKKRRNKKFMKNSLKDPDPLDLLGQSVSIKPNVSQEEKSSFKNKNESCGCKIPCSQCESILC